MRYKSKFKFFVLLTIGILLLNPFIGVLVLRNTANYKYEETIKSSGIGTYTVDAVTTLYGAFGGEGNVGDENEYLEWSISTVYGPGVTFYMMNNTEIFAYMALANPSRTRGNFAYTALLSDEEASASGTFYPPNSDTWWFVATNHYTGIDCRVDFVTSWLFDFITVDEPTNSISWEANTSHYIDWSSGGDFSDVDIELYHDGNFLRNIATNAQNNGTYLWKIPADISLFDDLYQVNISNANFDGTWGISDSYFEITGETTISVTRPFTSDSWGTGTIHSITWTSSGSIANVKIELFKDDVFELEIITSTPNDGEYSWAIPLGLGDSTQYHINITDVSNSSIYDFSDYFEIYVPDSITVISPDSMSSWETETIHSITWISTGSITDVKIELFKDDVFELEIISSTPNDGEYSWAIPLGLGDSTQYHINITDISNALTSNFSDYFEIYIPDSITVLSPDSLSSWETGTIYSITWVSTGSMTDIKIELFNDNVFELEIISSTPNDDEYSWDIPSGLDNSTQYQIKLTDVSNSAIYDYSVYFQIFTSPSLTPPPQIPGYNLFVLITTSFIGVFGIVISFYLRRNKKEELQNI